MIGQTISHYKILEKLGEGGMGVVYKAEDTKLKRTVALKFLPKGLEAHEPERARFLQEAQAASALNHPNICSIHTIEEYDGQQFIDMELVDGKNLSGLLKEKELSLKDMLNIAIQICEGLNSAHKKGVVHRDIKPDNIMLTDDGIVKIMDFGLAKLKGTSKLTKTQSTLGTLAYMSPEQARGEEVDQRSDIFSFGVVLYEMVTGRRPFKGEHEAAMMYSLMNENPEPLARYKTDVPTELQHIIDKSLAKERGERYQHIDEMVADMRRMQHSITGNITSIVKKSKMTWIAAAVFVVLVVVGVYLFYPKSVPIKVTGKSVAVLPFKNLSDSKEDEYFSDGITDDIIAQLSKISELKVISRTSTMQYKRINKNVREIGEELDVATVLEGSVRRVGNQIRVVAQLIDAKNEGHLWAETYDKEMIQIFEVQSDVAKKIAVALKTKLTSGEKERIEKKQTEDTEAYKLYLKGRFYWNKRVPDDIKTAIDCFKQAIEKDPDYALAYTGLASAYAVIPSFGLPPAEPYINARNAAMKALEIDSTLAEAQTVLGEIAGSHYYDWTVAEKHYRRAIELDPSYPTAHQWYSSMLTSLGRFDEALTEAKRALELDPLSLIINLNLGDVYYAMRRYNEAKEQYENIISLDETFPWSHSGLANIYEVQGRFDDAIAEYIKARDFGGKVPYSLGQLGSIYLKSGRKADALSVLDELRRLDKQGDAVSYGIATVYFELGEKDKAFEWFEKSYQKREMWLLSLGSDPLWDNIRSDPRGIALLKKMGLRK
jgi:eukaryotic-like serine/threonine-protein kinase